MVTSKECWMYGANLPDKAPSCPNDGEITHAYWSIRIFDSYPPVSSSKLTVWRWKSPVFWVETHVNYPYLGGSMWMYWRVNVQTIKFPDLQCRPRDPGRKAPSRWRIDFHCSCHVSPWSIWLAWRNTYKEGHLFFVHQIIGDFLYPLVMTNIATENGHWNCGFSH